MYALLYRNYYTCAVSDHIVKLRNLTCLVIDWMSIIILKYCDIWYLYQCSLIHNHNYTIIIHIVWLFFSLGFIAGNLCLYRKAIRLKCELTLTLYMYLKKCNVGLCSSYRNTVSVLRWDNYGSFFNVLSSALQWCYLHSSHCHKETKMCT